MLRKSIFSTIILYWLMISGESVAMKTTHKFIVDMLTDLKSNYLPVHISIFLCWEVGSLHELVHDLSMNYVTHSVHVSNWDIMEQLHASNNKTRSTFVLDLACPNWIEFLYEAQTLNLFNRQKKWILLNSCNTKFNYSDKSTNNNGIPPIKIDSTASAITIDACQKQTNELIHLNIFIDSDVSVAKRISENKFVLVEVYNLKNQKGFVQNEIGYWREDLGAVIKKSWLQSISRMNLQRSVIKAVIVVTNNDTKEHLTHTTNRHIDTISKVNYALFQHIGDILNASVEIIVVKSWGYPENGSWSGMSGYLYRGEADIGISSMFITKEHMEFVEFITSTTPTSAQFIFRQPQLSFMENVFTLPFSRTVWLFSTLLIAIIGVLFYFALKWEIHEDSGSNDKPIPRIITWSDMILSAVGAVSQQGTEVEGKKISGRIILLMLFVVVIFLYTSYSASIVALLQSTTNSINTLSDLLHSGLTLGVHDTDFNRHFFSMVKDPVRRAIYTRKIKSQGHSEHFYPMDYGLERVRTNFFAFHVELGPAYKVISETFQESEKCNLQTINYLIEVKNPWLAVSKKSPYKEALTRAYRMVHERGLQSRENLRFYHRKPECSSQGSNFVSVGIKDCYVVLLVLLYGILFAVGIMLLEIIAIKKPCIRRIN